MMKRITAALIVGVHGVLIVGVQGVFHGVLYAPEDLVKVVRTFDLQ